jgi:glycoprotein endo-alpha-1,2-mannosidase
MIDSCIILFHMCINSYEGRTPATVREDIEYLVAKYGDSPAFYRHPITNRAFYYAYDSYHNPPEQWAELLKTEGKISIRGHKKLDADVIGLVLESKDIEALARGGFDGAYTVRFSVVLC